MVLAVWDTGPGLHLQHWLFVAEWWRKGWCVGWYRMAR